MTPSAPRPPRPGQSQARSLPLRRREFLRRTSAAAGMLAALPGSALRAANPPAAGKNPVRVALVGCGARGLGAVFDALAADPAVRLVALADLFPDRLEEARRRLGARGQELPSEHCFAGLDACQRLLEVPDLAYVIHATPPAFRPAHFQLIVEAGLSVFLETPVAVDPPGVRSVIATAARAHEKGLSVVAGTQRRHQANYRETIRRLQDGAIGSLIEARVYALFPGAARPASPAPAGISDLESQVRDWTQYRWLSGDHLVEQHTHNLDVINWLKGAHPVRAIALGGRQTRETGNNYDHFGVEFEYADGFRMFSYSRQSDGCEEDFREAVLGTRGTSDCAQSIEVRGAARWQFEPATPAREAARGHGGSGSGYVQEHADLIAAIRGARAPLEEATACAESTLTAILGRTSAYTGRITEWDKVLASSESLMPERLDFSTPIPVTPPPIPGKTSAG